MFKYAPVIDKKTVGFFRFKKFGDDYLVTNDVGEYSFLPSVDFDLFLKGKIEQANPKKYQELQSKNFIRSRISSKILPQKYAKKNNFLKIAANLHIVVVTLRCNHRCIYCQAKSKNISAENFDMTPEIAKKVIDRIFECPNRYVTIEFQGGEPLANIEIIKFIINYSTKKNKKAKKNMRYVLISNLSLLNDDILSYLVANNVSICTSLDGHEYLHDKQRILSFKKNSHKNTIFWVKKIQEKYRIYKFPYSVGALATITRLSLKYHKEIIDEYIKIGLFGIHLRPVASYNIPEQKWNSIALASEDYIDFYKKALDYIIKLNFKGVRFQERFATIFLEKILTGGDPAYLDIRSPCGSGIGQIAYNFNGDVYTCDEGRMLSRNKDETFRLGNVTMNSYNNIINNDAMKYILTASCLDMLPGCCDCVYKPYCGVCPVCNHSINKNLLIKASFWCKIYKSILDYLFLKLKDTATLCLFNDWVNIKRRSKEYEEK